MATGGSNLNYPAAPAASSGFVSDFDEQSARLARKRRLAQMLQQQALQGVQLQNQSGPASWANVIAPMAQALAGQYADTKTDTEEKELQQKNQENLNKWIDQFPQDQAAIPAREMGPPTEQGEMSSQPGEAEKKMLPQDFIKWGLGGMQFGKAGQSIGEDVIKSYLPKKSTGGEDWKYETVFDDKTGRERKAWVNKSNPGAPPVFVGGESTATTLTKNVDFYKSKGYSEEDAIKMAGAMEHVVPVPAQGEVRSYSTLATKPGAASPPPPAQGGAAPPAQAAPVPTPAPAAAPPPIAPPVAPPVAPPAAAPVPSPAAPVKVTSANYTGYGGAPAGAGAPKATPNLTGADRMSILHGEYQKELAKGDPNNPNIKPLEFEMAQLEKKGIPRPTPVAPVPAAGPAPLDASNAPATPATAPAGIPGTGAAVSTPPTPAPSPGKMRITPDGPYDTTPKSTDPRMKVLSTSNNAAGQERLLKDASKVRDDLRHTGLPAYEQALIQAEKRLAEVPEGQLAGYGKVKNILPDAAVSEEARDNRLAIAPLLRIESLNAGGKAFTAIELEEIKKITGTGFGRSEGNLRKAVKQLRAKMDAIKKNELAGVHPDVLDYLGQSDSYYAGSGRPAASSFWK
jgi:hypothetical protein